MSKARTKIVEECLQCRGDELLGIRDSASQFTDVLDCLMEHFYQEVMQRKPDITAADIVGRLCVAAKDQRRLCRMLKESATRRCKAADELIAALKFLAFACNREHSSVNLVSGSVTLEMADLLKLATKHIESLVCEDRGLLNGSQPHNDVDFLADVRNPALPVAMERDA
jgi:hypothetical protein